MMNSKNLPDYLSEGAKSLITSAGAHASSLNHPYIGTEHILLALVDSGESVSSLFSTHGVTTAALLSRIEEAVGRGPDVRGRGDTGLPLTPRVETLIRVAHAIADKKFGTGVVHPEHLFMALFGAGVREGVALQILKDIAPSLAMHTEKDFDIQEIEGQQDIRQVSSESAPSASPDEPSM